MGKKPTPAAGLYAAAVCACMVVAGCAGEDPDPNAVARALRTHVPVAEPAPAGPPLAIAALAARIELPAPGVETRPRTELPPPRHAAIGVGHDVAHAFDSALQAAFVAACPGAEAKGIPCSDRDAIELVQQGRADFAVCGGNLTVRDQQAGLRGTRLGVELWALAVAPQSPLRSLTHAQVRQVFTGAVESWRQLGFDGGDIVAVVPSDRALAARAQKTLIRGDTFAASCVGVPDERHVADQLLRHPSAIAVVRVDGQPRVDGLRLLSIDWSPPTVEAFGYATYPFGIPVTLVTPGTPSGLAADFLTFARSDAGRELLARTLLPAP